eukprot:1157782-Pelagomonas_calceolata.AAC.1
MLLKPGAGASSSLSSAKRAWHLSPLPSSFPEILRIDAEGALLVYGGLDGCGNRAPALVEALIGQCLGTVELPVQTLLCCWLRVQAEGLQAAAPVCASICIFTALPLKREQFKSRC